MKQETKKVCLNRLGRIEGQVRGIARMIEDERYCIDIITQISAVQAALRKLEEELLKNHVSHCVEAAIASGDAEDQRRKVNELIEVLGRRSGR
jgi:DNA-binding FrmR family transcriptional regulator